MGELLWYYCSPVSGSLTQWIWDLILSWLHPSYCLPAASFFFFFGGFQHPPVDGCSADSCNFGALSGGISAHPSVPPSWTGSLHVLTLLSLRILDQMYGWPYYHFLLTLHLFTIFFFIFFLSVLRYGSFLLTYLPVHGLFLLWPIGWQDYLLQFSFHLLYFLSLESVWFFFKYIILLFIPYSLLFKNLSFIILNSELNCFKIHMVFPCLECECVAALCCFPDTDSLLLFLSSWLPLTGH